MKNEEKAQNDVVKESVELLKEFPVKTIEWINGSLPQPLPLHEPEKCSWDGTITAPVEFMTKRGEDHNKQLVNVVYNIEKGTILMVVEETNFFKKTIKGTLKLNPKIAEIGINGNDSFYDLKKLIRWIRFNKALFTNGGEHDHILNGLKTFNAKVQQELNKKDDQKGNIVDEFTQNVQLGFTPQFVMKLPVFKGYPARDFLMELHVAVRSRAIEFYFESPEMVEIIESEREAIVLGEVAKLQQYCCIQE